MLTWQMTQSNPIPAAASTESPASQRRGVWWRLPLLLLVVLFAIVAARSAQQRGRAVELDERPSTPPVAADGKAVALSIDFSDGRKREFEAIAWQSGMTVDDLMTAASRLPNGIRYTVGGDGEMTMLASIDGVENQWGGGSFWLYRVNDVLADRSLAVYELQPGDRVLWTFSDKE
jgi:hypothetical protein